MNLDCRTIRHITGASGNVFGRLPAREERTSTLFNNSKNLASYSRELGPDTEGHTKRPENGMRRDPQIRRYLHHASKVEVDCWVTLVKLTLTAV